MFPPRCARCRAGERGGGCSQGSGPGPSTPLAFSAHAPVRPLRDGDRPQSARPALPAKGSRSAWEQGAGEPPLINTWASINPTPVTRRLRAKVTVCGAPPAAHGLQSAKPALLGTHAFRQSWRRKQPALVVTQGAPASQQWQRPFSAVGSQSPRCPWAPWGPALRWAGAGEGQGAQEQPCEGPAE